MFLPLALGVTAVLFLALENIHGHLLLLLRCLIRLRWFESRLLERELLLLKQSLKLPLYSLYRGAIHFLILILEA